MKDEHEPLEETLRRLAREREEADRAYNDALTALDTALLRLPDLPAPPPGYDDTQITPLNRSWETLVAPPAAGGLKGRLAGFVWRLVAPSLQKQVAFNSALVDHLNRNVAGHRDPQRAIDALVGVVRAQVADLTTFHARLLIYLQQITGYVDTKDRETGGRALVVNAAINALADDLAKRWESLAVREQRFESRVASLTSAHDELRVAVGVAQQAALTVKRELERLTAVSTPNVQLPTPNQRPTPNAQASNSQASNAQASNAQASNAQASNAQASNAQASNTQASNTQASNAQASNTQAPSSQAFGQALDAYKYVGFEDQFRGSQETIRARLYSYLPYFDGASDVLDAGCGRGEFLDLLKAHGVRARGLDLNHEMVEVCRARGLDVAESDVVSYLEQQPDGSLGGLFAAQVVEHLEPAYLLRVLDLAFHKLRPGAPIVLETLNPACWTAFFDSFIRDITHVWPLHPETLRYLVLASGFPSARIEYRSPVPPQDRLQAIAAAAGAPGADLVETFNANVEKLNARMFSFLDYAIVGSR
jgi:SAM-dependent methyltransferase